MNLRPSFVRQLLPLTFLGSTIALLSPACGRTQYKKNEAIELIPEACCVASNKDMDKFAGCRPGGRCSADERLWLRGQVSCGPVEPERCLGKRCCHYVTPADGGPSVPRWEDPNDTGTEKEPTSASSEATPPVTTPEGTEVAPTTPVQPPTQAIPENKQAPPATQEAPAAAPAPASD